MRLLHLLFALPVIFAAPEETTDVAKLLLDETEDNTEDSSLGGIAEGLSGDDTETTDAETTEKSKSKSEDKDDSSSNNDNLITRADDSLRPDSVGPTFASTIALTSAALLLTLRD